MIRIGREEPGAAGRVPSHREDPRIVGVEHVPSVRACDPGDDGLHLGELIHRVDAVKPQVVLAHVRHDRDVVVPDADAAQQHPAPRRLEHRDIGFLLEGARGSTEAGVVAGLDQHAVVSEDAVGRGVRDRLPGAPHQVRQQSHRGGLPVRARHLHHGNVRIAHGRLVAGFDRDQPAPGLGDQPIGRASEHGGHPCGDLVRQGLGRRATPPWERDHDLVALRAGTGAHGESSRASSHGDPAGEVRGQARHHAPSLLALRRPGLHTCGHAQLAGDRQQAFLGDAEPPGNRERELDRRPGEVQVRPLQHPELDHPDRIGHVRPRAVRPTRPGRRRRASPCAELYVRWRGRRDSVEARGR
jgi:hypothetical protein